MKSLGNFLKEKRKQAGLTQLAFAERAGVALTVIRKIEQGKGNLQLEKVNHVLSMFGHSLAPVANKDIEKNQINDDENNGKWSLSPAYDLLNVNLANTKDKEELALSLEEKKQIHTPSI
jgi:y4mF family transcriptional regulator